jgi:phosphoribosylformylglycinamidine synthase
LGTTPTREGRAEFASADDRTSLEGAGRRLGRRAFRRSPRPSAHHPDSRATIIMPHPERVFRSVQLSWHPDDAGTDSPWLRLFRNARMFVG